MKLVKSLLLGSAAGLCAVAGAQAADLPMKKAAPVEYVRVCTAYGAGFFYIPGTDTCLRVGGRARFEAQFKSQRARSGDTSGYRGLGRLNLDARTATPYGTLRAFVRFEIASRTGGQLKSGTQQRNANAFFGFGTDSFNNQQKYVDVDKAFIQFAGLTAGRTQSFFDFYAHDLEFITNTMSSDVNTNLLAYTATFGSGFSATISMEDPTYRQQTAFATITSTVGTAGTSAPTAINIGAPAISPIGTIRSPAGVPIGATNLDVIENVRLPDFVGALRYDQAWGSVQLSGAVHELAVGLASGVYATPAAGTPAGIPAFASAAGAPAAVGNIPKVEYGYAFQAGLKLNVPQLAPGDVLWLQAAYSKGANSYTNAQAGPGQYIQSATFTNGRAHLTEAFSMTAALLHYWTPEVRQAVFGSWARVHFDRALRQGESSPLIGLFPVGGAAPSAAAAASGFGKDFNNFAGGSNLIWSPVKDLDIGVEALYERVEFVGGPIVNGRRGQVTDANKAVAGRTISYDDDVIVRMRVQRDF
jgi:hypothetical protein